MSVLRVSNLSLPSGRLTVSTVMPPSKGTMLDWATPAIAGSAASALAKLSRALVVSDPAPSITTILWRSKPMLT